jgi:transposase
MFTRDEELGPATARAEAVRLAKRVVVGANTTRMTELVQASQAAPLLEKTGIGPVTVAICLTAWSYHGRVRSEAAFAALAGVNPSPRPPGTPPVTASAAAATDA